MRIIACSIMAHVDTRRHGRVHNFMARKLTSRAFRRRRAVYRDDDYFKIGLFPRVRARSSRAITHGGNGRQARGDAATPQKMRRRLMLEGAALRDSTRGKIADDASASSPTCPRRRGVIRLPPRRRVYVSAGSMAAARRRRDAYIQYARATERGVAPGGSRPIAAKLPNARGRGLPR